MRIFHNTQKSFLLPIPLAIVIVVCFTGGWGGGGGGGGKTTHSQGILFHWSVIAPGVLYTPVRSTVLAADNIQANYQPWTGKGVRHAYSTPPHTLMQAQQTIATNSNNKSCWTVRLRGRAVTGLGPLRPFWQLAVRVPFICSHSILARLRSAGTVLKWASKDITSSCFRNCFVTKPRLIW